MKKNNGAIDFLKTKTSKDKLKNCLDVMNEFRSLESIEELMTRQEFIYRGFEIWAMFDLLEEHLEYLVNGKELKEDTKEAAKMIGIKLT